jgi:hypothetical protein
MNGCASWRRAWWYWGLSKLTNGFPPQRNSAHETFHLDPRPSSESRAQPQPVATLTLRQATDPLFDRTSILLLAKRIQKIRNRALVEWPNKFKFPQR